MRVLQQRLGRTIEQSLDQRRVTIQRGCDLDFDIAVSARGVAGQARKVALHVSAQRQEIGNDDDALCAARDEQCRGAREIRQAQFQERRFDNVLPAAGQ